MHIATECTQLQNQRYMIRHNLIVTRFHWSYAGNLKQKSLKTATTEHAPLPHTVTPAGFGIPRDRKIKNTIK